MDRHWIVTQGNIFKEHEALIKTFYIDLRNESNQKLFGSGKNQIIKKSLRKFSINNYSGECDLIRREEGKKDSGSICKFQKHENISHLIKRLALFCLLFKSIKLELFVTKMNKFVRKVYFVFFML
jgi:hypothetical protein